MELFVPCGGVSEYYSLSTEERIGVVKHGLDAAGYYGGPVRPPLEPMDESYRKQVERILEDVSAELGIAAD